MRQSLVLLCDTSQSHGLASQHQSSYEPNDEPLGQDKVEYVPTFGRMGPVDVRRRSGTARGSSSSRNRVRR